MLKCQSCQTHKVLLVFISCRAAPRGRRPPLCRTPEGNVAGERCLLGTNDGSLQAMTETDKKSANDIGGGNRCSHKRTCAILAPSVPAAGCQTPGKARPIDLVQQVVQHSRSRGVTDAPALPMRGGTWGRGRPLPRSRQIRVAMQDFQIFQRFRSRRSSRQPMIRLGFAVVGHSRVAALGTPC